MPVWYSGSMGYRRIKEALEKIKNLLEDERETWIYDNETVKKAKISDLVGEAMRRLCT